MGYPLTSPSDYTGVIAISTNQYSVKDLELFIATYEQEILQDLLGCDMSAELIADLDGNNEPVDVKFQEIWDAFCIDDSPSISFMCDYGQFYNMINYPKKMIKINWDLTI